MQDLEKQEVSYMNTRHSAPDKLYWENIAVTNAVLWTCFEDHDGSGSDLL